MKDIGGVDVLQATEDLINEGLEVGIRKRLPRSDDCCQVTFHKFWAQLAKHVLCWIQNSPTLVKVRLVEVVWSRNVHVVQACYLGSVRFHQRPQDWARLTFRCPLKCCRSLISLNALFAKIFLLKTFVTFLIATPSPVWPLVAALRYTMLVAPIRSFSSL